jgi:hypothetical protein
MPLRPSRARSRRRSTRARAGPPGPAELIAADGQRKRPARP